jgi:hypothetical protein
MWCQLRALGSYFVRYENKHDWFEMAPRLAFFIRKCQGILLLEFHSPFYISKRLGGTGKKTCQAAGLSRYGRTWCFPWWEVYDLTEMTEIRMAY